MSKPSEDITYVRREQLDREFNALKKYLPSLPKSGWIREIRSALQLTTTQLAKRLGVSQSVLSNLEKSERERTIRLNSLDRVAEALECEVHYVLIPKESLQKTLYDRAKILCEKDRERIDHQMTLEDQATKSPVREELDILSLILNKDKRIWEE